MGNTLSQATQSWKTSSGKCSCGTQGVGLTLGALAAKAQPQKAASGQWSHQKENSTNILVKAEGNKVLCFFPHLAAHH